MTPANQIISVVMPVKNTGNYLKPCLESIISQTTNHWELITVNDHSTDESNDILKHYANIDERIIVLQNQGSGIIDALQTAYENSTGEYITRMDSDDIMMPTKLATLHRELAIHGNGHVAVGGVRYFSQHDLGDGYRKYANWLNTLTSSANNFSEIYKECVIPSPCWMIHREDFNTCGGFDSNVYPEDYDLCFRFYQAGYKIAGNSIILHEWRDYPHRTSRTHVHYADNRFLDLKIGYFLKLDYNHASRLILWGAGKKGKLIARNLKEIGVDFTWITNNPNKIDKNVYGSIIKSSLDYSFEESDQIILVVANPVEQNEINLHIQSINVTVKMFPFC